MPDVIAVALAGGATQVVAGQGQARYAGITVRETSAAGALTLRLWDNASAASGTIVEVIVVPSGGAVQISPVALVHCRNGLFLERVAGTTYEGSIRLG